MDIISFETEVDEIIQRTYNVKSFRFARPKKFLYHPGQYLVIKIKSKEEFKMKHFTISSSPTEDYLEFTKKITDHEFSLALDRLSVGDWAEIQGPYGEFTIIGEEKEIAMFTGGIGITPMRSNIKYATDKKIPNKIILFYSNKTVKDIVFRDQLDQMKKQNPNLKILYTLTKPDPNWDGIEGYFNEEFVKKEIPDFNKWVFLTSGPPGLVENMSNLFLQFGIPEVQIRKEHFPGY